MTIQIHVYAKTKLLWGHLKSTNIFTPQQEVVAGVVKFFPCKIY